jgi:hypothetical protein
LPLPAAIHRAKCPRGGVARSWSSVSTVPPGQAGQAKYSKYERGCQFEPLVTDEPLKCG